MDEEEIYYWRKHGRPSPDNDRLRSALAEYVLHPLKTRASILKSTYIPIPSLHHEYPDFQPNILYSLNRKRRWEAEDSIGVDLLEELTQLNKGWRVTVVERVIGMTSVYLYGLCGDRFEEFYPIKKFHYLNDNNEYMKKVVKSVRGQTYHNFLRHEEAEPRDQGSIASYHFLRAPANIVTFLKKRFQDSNYHGHRWPRAGYWNRVNRGKDRRIELRYEELEDLEQEEQVEQVDHDEKEVKYYNLEDHLIDKFVMVKRRKSVK
ncbi:hypothetical protein GCK72_016524 [Caenorhabditis remanei]|uniref:Uncharacterized protein n=1 Tax=Caenorhabditis remanei TaxID=31234 RepID=A0A6A5G649_CAERE|nr:hypothetical protein GCK72_016524 [Caenorhabditis remanei]KAF1749979.1 hypothetical protein GCK72_016524 [Caenorhabditis remanei]